MAKVMKVTAILALSALLAFALSACGRASRDSNTETLPTSAEAAASSAESSSAASDAEPSASTAKEDRDGFDEASNFLCTVAGVQFQLPAYYGEGKAGNNGLTNYSLESNAAFVTQEDAFDVDAESFTEQQIDSIKNNFGQRFFDGKSEIQDTEETTIAGKPAFVMLIEGAFRGQNCMLKMVLLMDRSTQKLGMLSLLQPDSAQYNYLADFDRVVASGVAVEPEATESGDGAVSVDLKEWLDSYEAFMDEYVEFMQRYKDSGNATSMMTDYLNYLQRYSDFISKTDALDTDDMSAADYAYYLEVTTRVSKKLLEAAV